MRIDGWENILYDYLNKSKDLCFEWGANDCALWASSFVDLITGSNYASDWRGLYNTEEGAASLMAERGFANCEAIADNYLQEKILKLASRGDLVLHETGALGICAGRISYFLTPNSGLVAVMTRTCKKAWEV